MPDQPVVESQTQSKESPPVPNNDPQIRALVAEARAKGLWLFERFHGIWFSPDELLQARSEGTFRWGAGNWELRDPAERMTEITHEIFRLQTERNAFRLRCRTQGYDV